MIHQYFFRLSVVTLIFATGCNVFKANSGHSSFVLPTPKAAINLSEVSNQNCMNISKFFSAINALYPNPAIREISTDFSAISDHVIFQNFMLKTAFSNFAFKSIYREQIPTLLTVSQVDCATVSVMSSSGDSEEFKILEALDTRIRFESRLGESYAYEWISPQHFKSIHRFWTGDFLCEPEARIFLSIAKDYSWEPIVGNSDSLPANTISENFLTQVAEACDVPIDSLYANQTSDGSDASHGELLTRELTNLSSHPLDSKYLGCSANSVSN